MAGETVLIVDDSVVNLKLAAAVLRSDGYRVTLATSAEQALMSLRTSLPEVALVDLQLPGMNGIELTQRIRQDERTRKLVVVVLTAAMGADIQQQAYAAGCNGFLAKPIDTRTLGARLRSFLEATAPDPEPVSELAGNGDIPTLSLAGPEMDSLRHSFLTEGLRQIRRMLDFDGSEVEVAAAVRLFHQWIGSAGALGYSDIAEQARAAEILVTTPGRSQSDLRIVLSGLADAFAAPREAAETQIPETIAATLDHRRIALVGFAEEEAERVCVAFEKVRALPRLFHGDEPPDSDSIRDCSVVMVHVREQTRELPWLSPAFPYRQPLVLVGGREELISLPPAVQARACEFLIDGWQPEEVVMRLSFAMARAAKPAEASEPAVASDKRPDIVIADDDTNVLAVVRKTLENLGMECRPASSGPEAMRLMQEHCPQAAVLDVNMPGMDGFEVLTEIRKAGWKTKVIMLTARQHERDVLRGFELGADDYVAKPFNPLELAARLKRLI